MFWFEWRGRMSNLALRFDSTVLKKATTSIVAGSHNVICVKRPRPRDLGFFFLQNGPFEGVVVDGSACRLGLGDKGEDHEFLLIVWWMVVKHTERGFEWLYLVSAAIRHFGSADCLAWTSLGRAPETSLHRRKKKKKSHILTYFS